MAAATAINTSNNGPPTPTRTRPTTSRVLSGSPRTPLMNRSISGAFGSPGVYSREPEEVIIYELTPRYLSAGFSGESRPRCITRFGYSMHDGRRTGDLHNITVPVKSPIDLDDMRRYNRFELYRAELRDLNLGLVRDRLERVVRSIHIDHLQLDQKPRKAILVVSSLTPTKILDLVLDVLFNHYAQPPAVTLLNNTVMSCVAAGLRNALVIDIGWEESIASVVGEYRVIAERRSVRGGKMLTDNLASMLRSHSSQVPLDFCKVEEIRRRVTWCRSAHDEQSRTTELLLPVADGMEINLNFEELAKPVETTFFPEPDTERSSAYDDQELPLPLLALQALTAVSSDLRSACASRIILTGEYAQIPGLRTRLLQEIDHVLKEGWPGIDYGSKAKPTTKFDMVVAKPSVDETPAPALKDASRRTFGHNHAKIYPILRAADGSPQSLADVKAPQGAEIAVRPDWRPLDAVDFRLDLVKWLKVKGVYGEAPIPPVKETNASSTKDPATDKLDRDLQKKEVKPFDGVVKAVDSLGAWAGASMVANLHVKGIHEIEREEFLKHGYRESMTNMI